jgi:hypothetical protein
MKAASILIGLLLFAAHAACAADPPEWIYHPKGNYEGQTARPLRYQPIGTDFVITNGPEFFNRPLYCLNSAFRIDGGDKPEFSLYLPGRGGNLRFGIKTPAGVKWLSDAEQIVARYRPGSLLYEIRDPLLGDGELDLAVLPLSKTKGLIAQVELRGAKSPTELIWAFGGANGVRGRRGGDIGCETEPVGKFFQLKPEQCRSNEFIITSNTFVLRSKPATILGVASAGAKLAVGDATKWNSPGDLLGSAAASLFPRPATKERGEGQGEGQLDKTTSSSRPSPPSGEEREGGVRSPADGLIDFPVLVGENVWSPAFRRLGVVPPEGGTPNGGQPVYLALQQSGDGVPVIAADDLPKLFSAAEDHRRALAERIVVDTPDPFINAAVPALCVAGDAIWDDQQQCFMHGAVAWRARYLGWRGPYAGDALGWHHRTAAHFAGYAKQQNTNPVPDKIPPADENVNLSRNEAALHSNGDLTKTHYDMNLVAVDAFFRHLLWTGDLDYARQMWPVIERHLAWERRLFRREFGPDKLPLYEAYAAIWASDNLNYNGGGTAHASAYNYWHNQMAARVAKAIGQDPVPYEREADLILRAMRKYLWLPDEGSFAEVKDYLGLQLVHPNAGLWTFYHTVDSGVPTPAEAWQMSRWVDTHIAHIPVCCPAFRRPESVAGSDRLKAGQQTGPHSELLFTLPETSWMPYMWSINNVVMAEVAHTALAHWQANRPQAAFALFKGCLLDSMYLGLCPGNVGAMSHFDMARGEAQRDFGDSIGITARALVEGLFGVRPDALAGELKIVPGFPLYWDHASIRHPDFDFEFRRTEITEIFLVESKFSTPMALRLQIPALREKVAKVTVNGRRAKWQWLKNPAGVARIEIQAEATAQWQVVVVWKGKTPSTRADSRFSPRPGSAGVPPARTEFAGETPALPGKNLTGQNAKLPSGIKLEAVNLTSVFNDRITQIFKNEYRSPRSPFCSLALPKQGLGGWCDYQMSPHIDDSGLRESAAKAGGKLILPNGVPIQTPTNSDDKNIIFTSQWDNYPREVTVPLSGKSSHAFLLMAGSTGPMQSRFDNGEVIVTYTDGTTCRLALNNPVNWWPIEQDYFIDDYAFRRPEPIPPRVDLKTGTVRVLDVNEFKGKGGAVPGGAATVLELPLNPAKELKSLTVRALANEVVIGLMAVTLER